MRVTIVEWLANNTPWLVGHVATPGAGIHVIGLHITLFPHSILLRLFLFTTILKIIIWMGNRLILIESRCLIVSDRSGAMSLLLAFMLSDIPFMSKRLTRDRYLLIKTEGQHFHSCYCVCIWSMFGPWVIHSISARFSTLFWFSGARVSTIALIKAHKPNSFDFWVHLEVFSSPLHSTWDA